MSLKPLGSSIWVVVALETDGSLPSTFGGVMAGLADGAFGFLNIGRRLPQR